MSFTAATRLEGDGRMILVVDDDLAIRVLLNAVLTRMHFQVELAEDGAAGLEKLQKNSKFDLILLDLMMPKMNGYEFINRVNAALGPDHPHMIVFTAAGQRGVEKIPPNSVCNSILKPFDLESFLQMLEGCINRSHQRPAATRAD